MIGMTGIHIGDFPPPAVQFPAGDPGIGREIVNDIVHFTAKSVQCRDGPSAFGRKKAETDIKTGTAFCRLVLAILVWQHEC